MAISLADIKRSVSGAPRIVFYGVQGIGKSTFAAMAEAPVFIPIEDGCGDLTDPEGTPLHVEAFPRPDTYSEVLECIGSLAVGEHNFRTCVIDSLDKLEPMLWDYVCKEHSKKSIEDFGYGKGYTIALKEWRNLLDGLDALRARGMATILLAHSAVVKVEPPETDPYDRYQMRLHKSADATVCEWADAVLFANYKVTTVSSGGQGSERRRGISDGSRVICTTERAAWRAKNRYRMPDQLPLDWAAVSQYLPKINQPV